MRNHKVSYSEDETFGSGILEDLIAYEKDMKRLISAKPVIEEPDKTKVQWTIIKKWKRRRQRITCRPDDCRTRPSKDVYYAVLKEDGRDISKCERCESTDNLNVHHIDGNPFNNIPKNLVVLCWFCHRKCHRHHDDYDVIDDAEGIIIDF